MSGKYSTDRKWSDQFIPDIRRIVGPYLLIEAPLEVDQQQAADLITLKARDLTIACRVRRRYSPTGLDYLNAYGNEFTIRCKRDSGAKTELEKIEDGWGDWMFYAIANSNEYKDGIARWSLIDLSSWRAHMIRNSDRIRRGEAPNDDGTYFAWFDIWSFPESPPLLIDSSERIRIAQKIKTATARQSLVAAAVGIDDSDCPF